MYVPTKVLRHQNLKFYDSEDDYTTKLIIHGRRLKDASNMTFNELIAWAEEEASSLIDVDVDMYVSLRDVVAKPKVKRKLVPLKSKIKPLQAIDKKNKK